MRSLATLSARRYALPCNTDDRESKAIYRLCASLLSIIITQRQSTPSPSRSRKSDGWPCKYSRRWCLRCLICWIRGFGRSMIIAPLVILWKDSATGDTIVSQRAASDFVMPTGIHRFHVLVATAHRLAYSRRKSQPCGNTPQLSRSFQFDRKHSILFSS